MPRRKITDGERSLLRQVFEETLPYPKLEVATNDWNIGGKTNSITPEDVPYLSITIWSADFSGPSVPKNDQSTFIHEFTHVWQHYHGVHKLLSAAWAYVSNKGDYDEAYWYDLADSNDLTDYNLEQQTAIIEDFWRINSGLGTLRNKGHHQQPGSLLPLCRASTQRRAAPHAMGTADGLGGAQRQVRHKASRSLQLI